MSHMDWVPWYHNIRQSAYYYGKYHRLGYRGTYGMYGKEIPPLASIGLVPQWYWLYEPSTIQHSDDAHIGIPIRMACFDDV